MAVSPCLRSDVPRAGSAATTTALLLMTLIALTPACDRIGKDRDPFNTNRGAPAFRIKDPQRYKPHGIYTDFLDSHQTLLVSRRAAVAKESVGTMLVALDATCPYDGKPVEVNDLTRMLHCRGCDSRWTHDGLIQSGSRAKSSLDRFRIRLAGSGPSRDRDLIVDHSRRYRQSYTKQVGDRTIEIQEWSATDSMYYFALDPRHEHLGAKIETKAERER